MGHKGLKSALLVIQPIQWVAIRWSFIGLLAVGWLFFAALAGHATEAVPPPEGAAEQAVPAAAETPPETPPESPPEPPPEEPPPAWEGAVAFGSSRYRWNEGENHNLGIYANSTVPLGNYEIVLQYDTSMLTYNSGASARDGNLLYIRGSGSAVSYHTMLNFTPRRGGNTTIRVVSAAYTAAADENGQGERELSVNIGASAPVAIQALAEPEPEEEAEPEPEEEPEPEPEPEPEEEPEPEPEEEPEPEPEPEPEEEPEPEPALPVMAEKVEYIYPEDTLSLNPISAILFVILLAFLLAVAIYGYKFTKAKREREEVKGWNYLEYVKLDDLAANGEKSGETEKMPTGFAALKKLGIDIYPGDIAGVVFADEAGKNEFLATLSKALNPKAGGQRPQSASKRSGFERDFTLQENVYKFGTSIGYPKEHLDKKYSEIVAFAETEKNMGMYGKNVSTEKILRLKFAIATFREAAKIIVLDDLLSTKDMHFVRKGMKRIKELADSGVSVLIITASMEIAESYCDKVYNI